VRPPALDHVKPAKRYELRNERRLVFLFLVSNGGSSVSTSSTHGARKWGKAGSRRDCDGRGQGCLEAAPDVCGPVRNLLWR
jgi:hypothetical protein